MDTKRKALVILLALITMSALLLAGCGGGSSGEEPKWDAMDSLGATEAMDITRIDFSRSTEGGVYSNSVYDLETIENICLRLKDVTLGSETDTGVDDNGLSLSIKTADSEMNFDFEGDFVTLEDGKRYEVEGLDSLRTYIDGLIEEMGAAGDNGGGTASSGDYDIMANFQKNPDGSLVSLYFNDFMLIMPNNEKYSFEASEDKQSVTFYLFSAQQEGYGGRLVTIAAYDMNDNSYEEIPSYHLAGVGKNVNKRFIAIYPTDVQWNHDDPQQEADYRELQDHLQKIGEGAANSPLQTADSD